MNELTKKKIPLAAVMLLVYAGAEVLWRIISHANLDAFMFIVYFIASIISLFPYLLMAYCVIQQKSDFMLPLSFLMCIGISIIGEILRIIFMLFYDMMYISNLIASFYMAFSNPDFLFFIPITIAAFLTVTKKPSVTAITVLGFVSVGLLGLGCISRLYSFFAFIVGAILVAAFAVMTLHLRKLAQERRDNPVQNNSYSSYHSNNSTADDGFISMVTHVILILFAGWIWLYIWIYKMTAYTNRAKVFEDRNPTNKLLLCMFVPFYFCYWTYHTSLRIDYLGRQVGIGGDSSTVSTVLSFFVPIAAPIIQQNKVNNICTGTGTAHTYQSQPGYQAAQPQQPSSSSTIEDLKQYKELLDAGIITEEEFAAKKKQLLGL